MKKIAVLTDIHSNAKILKEILKDLEKENIDEYIFCGDYITDGFENNEVISIIRNLSNYVIAGSREEVIRNYDGKTWEDKVEWLPSLYAYYDLTKENMNYIKGLKTFDIYEFEGYRIAVSHGSPYNVKEYVYEDNYELFDKMINDYNVDIFLFGHTHIPFSFKYKDKYFFNSGAISFKKDETAESSCLIITLDENINAKFKKYAHNMEEIKKYYLNTDYYNKCPDWSNLLYNIYNDGIDYCTQYVKHLNEKNIDMHLCWGKHAEEYIQENNLKKM